MRQTTCWKRNPWGCSCPSSVLRFVFSITAPRILQLSQQSAWLQSGMSRVRFPGLDQNSQLPPNGQLCEIDISVKWTLLWDGHFCETNTSVRRTPLWDRHLCVTDTSVRWTPLWDGHFCEMDTSGGWTPLWDRHLCVMDASVRRTPRLPAFLY